LKVEYINPVLSACSSILRILLFEEIKLGKPELRRRHVLVDSIAVIFWMNGDFNCRFMFSMKRSVALRIASTMVGHEVKELDEFSKSAIGEMASMILGRSGILYSEKEIHVNISFPNIIEGDNLFVSPLAGEAEGKILKVPLHFSNGDIVDVRIEQK
jgi:chemotaxis protein CheX